MDTAKTDNVTVQPAPARAARVFALLAAAMVLAGSGTASAREFIVIGTGDVTGVPYHAGGAICSIVNAGRADHQIRCTVKRTSGSIANIDALRRGERAFGIAQSDLVQLAYRGTGVFADQGEFDGLRIVAALHAETVTLLAADDAGITSVLDLRGKRVNLGSPESGERVTIQALLDALGWTTKDFAAATEFDTGSQIDALCSGALDAALLVAGHPNNVVNTALECGAELVPIRGPAIDRMVRNAPYYNNTVIPAGVYRGIPEDTATFGVIALLLSSTNSSRQTVLEVTRSVFTKSDQLRSWHPAFEDLWPVGIAGGARDIEVPLHPGAEAYYREAGLIN